MKRSIMKTKTQKTRRTPAKKFRLRIVVQGKEIFVPPPPLSLDFGNKPRAKPAITTDASIAIDKV